MTSPDGSIWTARSSGVGNYIERITWASGLWVAVCEHGDITISANGTTWTPTSSGPPYTDHEGIAFGNGTWVAAGGYFRNPQTESGAVTTIYTSSDAQTWTLQPFDLGRRLRDVTFARGHFVAVGNDGAIVTSTNGTRWTVSFTTGSITYENLRRTYYANGRFVIVGNNGTLFSASDPTQLTGWTRHRSRTSLNLHDVHAAADGTFYAVGNNGNILQSGGTLPRFSGIQPVNGGYQLSFEPGLAEGNLRLESSLDLRSWSTQGEGVTSPTIVPGTNSLGQFYRLVIP